MSLLCCCTGRGGVCGAQVRHRHTTQQTHRRFRDTDTRTLTRARAGETNGAPGAQEEPRGAEDGEGTPVFERVKGHRLVCVFGCTHLHDRVLGWRCECVCQCMGRWMLLDERPRDGVVGTYVCARARSLL